MNRHLVDEGIMILVDSSTLQTTPEILVLQKTDTSRITGNTPSRPNAVGGGQNAESCRLQSRGASLTGWFVSQ